MTIKLLEWFATAREASEGRFRALVQHASDIIVVTDSEGRLQLREPGLRTDPRASPPSDFGTVRPASSCIPDDLIRMRAMSDDLPTAGAPRYVSRTPPAAWRWFEATVTDHLEDPNVLGIVANLHDISARKAAEDALKAAHERFRSAFENAPIGMAMVDLEGRIIRANPALGAIVGQDPGRAVPGQACTTSPIPTTASRPGRDANAGGHRLRGLPDREALPPRDGHEVWVSVSVSCVRDDEERPLYLIGQVEDVTERRALRERLAYAAIHDPLTGLCPTGNCSWTGWR
jgi:PAS domain S-box-containing protein